MCQVRVSLTEAGTVKLDALAQAHLEELAHLAPTMRALWETLESDTLSTPQAPSLRATVGRPG
jgi:hypothetical protein